jgi:hypothetical protein
MDKARYAKGPAVEREEGLRGKGETNATEKRLEGSGGTGHGRADKCAEWVKGAKRGKDILTRCERGEKI